MTITKNDKSKYSAALSVLCGLTVSSPVYASGEGRAEVVMPKITIESKKSKDNGYTSEDLSLSNYTSSIKNTPQSITVIPRKLIVDQGATNTSDVLRNVAGISLAAGEGGAQGNNLTLRGFTARSDFFVDGMRDFASYYRDPFNIENIEVLKGPSSASFGRGSTGGVINQENKTAKIGSTTDTSLTIGTDSTRRATADINRSMDEIKNAAFRLNFMNHSSNVAGRDVAQNNRFGFAPTLSFGIGTGTRTTVSYLHQNESNTPDYGLPWILNKPADVNRSNYYGFERGNNYMKTNVDILTTKIEHDIDDNTKIKEQIRYTRGTRDSLITEPKVSGSITASTPYSNITIDRNQIAASSTETMLDSQTSITNKFKTGNIKHVSVSGVELIYETSSPIRSKYTGVPTTSLLNPTSSASFSGTGVISSNVQAKASTMSVYFSDTISVNDKFDFLIGGRLDKFHIDYTDSANSINISQTNNMPSIRSSAVYKPTKDGSFYASYGTSFNPSAESLSFSSNPTTANGNAHLDPEKNETYEVGAKWDFFKSKLNTIVSIFRTNKTNARTTDPNNPLLNILSGSQRVDGFEAQATGNITEKLQIFAGYAYMKTQVLSSGNANEIGNMLQNAPAHTLNIWATYKLAPHFEVGGGANGVSSRAGSITPDVTTGLVKYAPGYVTFSAMAKYTVNDKINLQLNVYNLANKFYYDQMYPSHIVPGSGRYALLTTNIKLD